MKRKRKQGSPHRQAGRVSLPTRDNDLENSSKKSEKSTEDKKSWPLLRRGEQLALLEKWVTYSKTTPNYLICSEWLKTQGYVDA